jgi:hypothetical protein
MVQNIEQFASIGTRYAFWGVRVGNALNGTTNTTLANGASSAMARALALQTFGVTIPAPSVVSITGDNGVLGSFTVPSTDAISGEAAFGALDMNLATIAVGNTIKTDGVFDVMLDSQTCASYSQLLFILNSPGKSLEPATQGQQGYYVHEYLNVNATPTEAGFTSNEIQSFPYTFAFDSSTREINGLALTGFGGTSGFRQRYFSKYPIHAIAYKGTGVASQTVTTTYPVAEPTVGSWVKVTSNGVLLAPVTDYTVTGTAINFVGTGPAAGAVVVVKYGFVAGC